MEERRKILELRKLKKYFPIAKGVNLKAVEDISMVVFEGEKFGIVGESGCGKSTLGRTILQLYNQTSGSCVYYGKSIRELKPRYILKELDSLKKYQQEAKDCFAKSEQLLAQIQKLNEQSEQFDADGSAKDAKKYDAIKRKIAKLEFAAKEHRKEASRKLREGSRTVGSLILSGHLDDVVTLFKKAYEEIALGHDCLVKRDHLHTTVVDHQLKLSQYQQDPVRFKAYAKYSQPASLQEDQKMLDQIAILNTQIEEHRTKEKEFRKIAFDKYHGKDILDITERCRDLKYQAKLDGNYERGINLNKLTKKELRQLRPDMQMVFQDPAASLDPRQTIGQAIEEPFKIHKNMPASVRKEKVLKLLKEVNLKPEHYDVYPNALSGGMKQRAGIARAIALDPSVIVLDEAVSALDVSVQAQILALLNDLQTKKNLTYLFITHDLGVVKHFCDRVAVMYLGNLCELGDTKTIFKKPLHPYTQSLLDAVPHIDVDRMKDTGPVLQGEVPSPIHVPSGCPFHTRCRHCMEICKKEKPEYQEYEAGHFVACHLYRKDVESC